MVGVVVGVLGDSIPLPFVDDDSEKAAVFGRVAKSGMMDGWMDYPLEVCCGLSFLAITT